MGRHLAFERGLLWGLDLHRTENALPALVPPRIETLFEEIHESDVDALAAVMGLDSRPVLRRLATGRRCIVGRVEGEIAVYGWISQGKECVGELEREIHMRAGEAYIWDCGTLPAYRNQGLYSALLSYSNHLLHKEGIGRIWIGTGEANAPSLRGIINAGFQPAIRVTYFRVFKLCGLWVNAYPEASKAWASAAQQALTGDHERVLGRLVVASYRRMGLSSCAQLRA